MSKEKRNEQLDSTLKVEETKNSQKGYQSLKIYNQITNYQGLGYFWQYPLQLINSNKDAQSNNTNAVISNRGNSLADIVQLKQILLINPFVIYKDQAEFHQQSRKLKSISHLAFSLNSSLVLLGYWILLYAYAQIIQVAKSPLLRRNYCNRLFAKSFFMPLIVFYGYSSYMWSDDKFEKDFSLELERVRQIDKKKLEYQWQEKYIKNKMKSLFKQKVQYLILNEEDNQSSQSSSQLPDNNLSAQAVVLQSNNDSSTAAGQIIPNSSKSKADVRGQENYYYEISDIIEELDEENFFD